MVSSFTWTDPQTGQKKTLSPDEVPQGFVEAAYEAARNEAAKIFKFDEAEKGGADREPLVIITPEEPRKLSFTRFRWMSELHRFSLTSMKIIKRAKQTGQRSTNDNDENS